MNLPLIGLLTATAFLLSAGLTWILTRLKTGLTPACEINERSLHTQPVPRGGGLAIVGAVLLGGFAAWRFGLLSTEIALPWGFAIALTATVSYIDDHRHLAPALRLTAQILSIGIAALWFQQPIHGLLPELDLDAAWLTLPVALLFGVWMINLYNFMDGLDGLAGGMTVFGFGALAVMGWIQNDPGFVIANLLVVAGVLGFLPFNLPPATIFLGDIGSTVLGLLSAAYSLWASGAGLIPLWISALAFSPFIVDATVTLLLRALRREKVWQAHRRHYYQRLACLNQNDNRPARVLRPEYLLMFCCALSAVLLLNADPVWAWPTLGFWAAVYLGLIQTVVWLEKRDPSTDAKPESPQQSSPPHPRPTSHR